MRTEPVEDVLDDPVWSALAGPHASFARADAGAMSYHTDVAPFSAIPRGAGPDEWAGLARLVEAEGTAYLFNLTAAPPAGWEITSTLPLLQMVDTRWEESAAGRAAATERLGPADVSAMLSLVAAARPGPFRSRTIELGAYRGVREGTEIVAMAGERLHPTGWTEISAICTHPRARGRGLASALVDEVVAGIRSRGERCLLHVDENNAAAIGLYRHLGFEVRKATPVVGVRPPRAHLELAV